MSESWVERVAKARVYDVASQTALDALPRLSARTGNEVLLKREDMQPVFSFKLRGACNKIANLPEDVARHGVICASAGNHAQGVALAARRRGIPAVIVMPVTTPQIKVDAVKNLGAEVVLYGDVYDAASEHAVQIAAQRRMVSVHPFDDPDVIAGQGTIGMEILRQAHGEVDAIFVPVGGGGLIAGVAAYVKAVCPRTRVIGVEPEDAAAMHDSLRAGHRVTLDHVGIFADGVAVRRVGEQTFALAQRFVDEVLLVDTDQICAAIQDIFEDTRMVPEPSGALAIAGLKNYVARESCKGQRLVAINSGANLNFDRLRYVAERADVGAGREALFAVEIPEQRGSFLSFCRTLGLRNITEFNYREQGRERANVFVGVNLGGQGAAERERIAEQLRHAGYRVLDLTDNELAKTHVRHMVGGRSPGLDDELLFRFEFPERPGALLRFLEAVGTRWNISLFHYRNHGSDCGRVLVGIQVSPDERGELQRHLIDLNYPYFDESTNPAYRMFLGG
ncbi:MAG: threonine ammonia-lyase, biosynthetic [Nevskiaceae bacterium]|jgi:threonine dehydratase|nr:threonine ammonia-lyase, biosynthetic [Nevskiaceae bacterium]